MKNSQLIKENKIAGGYTKIYPLAYIQGIYDSRTGEELIKVLKSINHIYLPYNGTSKETRESLPSDYRRKGIIITYKVDDELITEVYIGNDKDVNADTLFTADINWEIVPDLEFVKNNASKIPNGAIIPEHLSPALWELLSKNHTITNFPDEEDLTQHCKVLKFKDRNTSAGKGYKILRKNWVNGDNILESSEISLANTIYEIRYDFDLNGQEITLPNNATLLFNGGTFNNGKVICVNTNILGINKFEDAGNAEYSGTFLKGLLMNIDDTVKWYDGTQWVSIKSDGSGSGSFIGSATVVSVEQSEIADASVELVGEELQFSFSLPKGKDGTVKFEDFTEEQLASLKGEKGDQGPIGPTGPQGPQGEQGPAGDVAVSTQTFMIFKSTEDSTQRPATPTGGHWDSTKGIFTPPSTWSRDDELGGYVWMSSGIFRADSGELVGTWSVPVLVTGLGQFKSFVFTRSNDEPSTPEGGSYTNPIPTNPIGVWTDGIPEGTEIIWMSSRIFTSDGMSPQQESWTKPIQMTDTADFEVIYSPKEEYDIPPALEADSKVGADLTVKWKDEAAKKYWYDDSGEWNVTGNAYKGKPAKWMATNKAKNGVWQGWVISQILGEQGSPGADGTNIEFIYKLTVEVDLENPPVLDKTDSPNYNGYVPDNWEPSPSGISPSYKCEWVSSRTKDSDGNWENWSDPHPWSIWSVDGRDGDGVEYIYFRNNGASVSNPTPENYLTNEDYQSKDKEYVPEELGWKDSPQGVSDTLQYEWVCVRKYRYNDDIKKMCWGPFSDPVVWAHYGENGYNGLGLRTMYAKYPLGQTPPVINNVNNPGSAWGLVIPTYDSETEAVWAIQAYVNLRGEFATKEEGATYIGWQGPWIISGVPGPEGKKPNYKTTVFALADSRPEKPTSDDPENPGTSVTANGKTATWVDYPNSVPTGNYQWWQCTGVVDGLTDKIARDEDNNLMWGTVINTNGKDGVAQDGKYYQMRFRAWSSNVVSNTYTLLPEEDRTKVSPPNWYLPNNMPKVTEELPYLWEIIALFDSDGNISGTWCDPFCITGEQGPQGFEGPAGPPGETGSQGISGIHGVDLLAMYCLGTEDTYLGSSDISVDEPDGWSFEVPTTTEENPYVWCIQGQRIYNDAEDTTGHMVWRNPFRLSGLDGLGIQGKKGQIIYPMGIFDPNTTYVTTEDTAPYVYDPSGSAFYVLNAIGSWRGKYQPSDINTPAKDYTVNGGKYWLKFTGFEAIYAKIGIIANGLIGSAVFNTDYMFSQQGVDASGTPRTYNDIDGRGTPASVEAIENGTWIPNILLNFSTGEAWFGAGTIKFEKNSTGGLSGDITMNAGYDQEAMGNLGTFINKDKLEFVNNNVRLRVGAEYIDKGVFALSSAITDSDGGATERIIINVYADGSGYIGRNQEISWKKNGEVSIGGLKVTEEGIGTDEDGYLTNFSFLGKSGIISAGTRTSDSVVSSTYQRMNSFRYDGKTLNILSNVVGTDYGNPTFTDLVYFKFDKYIFKVSHTGIYGSKDGGSSWIDILEGGNSGSGSGGSVSSNIQFVEELPETGVENTLYVIV